MACCDVLYLWRLTLGIRQSHTSFGYPFPVTRLLQIAHQEQALRPADGRAVRRADGLAALRDDDHAAQGDGITYVRCIVFIKQPKKNLLPQYTKQRSLFKYKGP